MYHPGRLYIGRSHLGDAPQQQSNQMKQVVDRSTGHQVASGENTNLIYEVPEDQIVVKHAESDPYLFYFYQTVTT